MCELRECTNCGKLMTSGYVINDGEEYFCDDECLHSWYSEEEYDELCQEDSAYWTEWEGSVENADQDADT